MEPHLYYSMLEVGTRVHVSPTCMTSEMDDGVASRYRYAGCDCRGTGLTSTEYTSGAFTVVTEDDHSVMNSHIDEFMISCVDVNSCPTCAVAEVSMS